MYDHITIPKGSFPWPMFRQKSSKYSPQNYGIQFLVNLAHYMGTEKNATREFGDLEQL